MIAPSSGARSGTRHTSGTGRVDVSDVAVVSDVAAIVLVPMYFMVTRDRAAVGVGIPRPAGAYHPVTMERDEVHVSELERLVARIRDVSGTRSRPVFVGLDGRSGSGKSTLAARLADTLHSPDGTSIVTVVEGDQFYAGGSGQAWDRRTVRERAEQVIDWRRQREVLVALRDLGHAEWHSFDWLAADWDCDDVPYAAEPTTADVLPVNVLEGAYSCRPELHDLLDLRVLLDPPTDVRRQQLLSREGEAYRTDWEARWSAAEDYYFGAVMPAGRFDLVLRPGGSTAITDE